MKARKFVSGAFGSIEEWHDYGYGWQFAGTEMVTVTIEPMDKATPYHAYNDPEGVYGYGKTEAQAVEDLAEQLTAPDVGCEFDD